MRGSLALLVLWGGCVIIVDTKDPCEGDCDTEVTEDTEVAPDTEASDTEASDTDLVFTACSPASAAFSADLVPVASVSVNLADGSCAASTDVADGPALVFQDFATELGAYAVDLTIVATDPGTVDDTLGDATVIGLAAGETVEVRLTDGADEVWVRATLTPEGMGVRLTEASVFLP